MREEQVRRRAAVATADSTAQKAAETQRQAREAEHNVREEFGRAEKALVDARMEFRDAVNQMKQARAELDRLRLEVARDFAELPPSYQERVGPNPAADWSATTFPSPADVQALCATAAGLAAAQSALHRAEQAWQQWNKAKAQESAIQLTLARLQSHLPAEPQAVAPTTTAWRTRTGRSRRTST